MSCTYTYKNKEYSEQEILDLLKQENKSFWNRLTRTGLGLLTPETREAILNEASKKYGIARGESKTATKYSQAQQNEIDLSSEKVKQQTNRILFQSPKLQYTGDLAIEEKIAEEAENSKDEIVAKTPLQKFIQSIRNLLRNIFKEKDKVSRLLRDMNQGRLNRNNSGSISQGVNYQLSKEQSYLHNLPPSTIHLLTVLRKLQPDFRIEFIENMTDRALVDFERKAIQISRDADFSDITEEIVHILVEMLPNDLKSRLDTEVLNTKVYGEVFEAYKNDLEYSSNGVPNINKIKREAVGQLLTAYFSGTPIEKLASTSISSKILSLIKKIMDYIRGNIDPVKEALSLINSGNLTNKLPDTGIYKSKASFTSKGHVLQLQGRTVNQSGDSVIDLDDSSQDTVYIANGTLTGRSLYDFIGYVSVCIKLNNYSKLSKVVITNSTITAFRAKVINNLFTQEGNLTNVGQSIKNSLGLSQFYTIDDFNRALNNIEIIPDNIIDIKDQDVTGTSAYVVTKMPLPLSEDMSDITNRFSDNSNKKGTINIINDLTTFFKNQKSPEQKTKLETLFNYLRNRVYYDKQILNDLNGEIAYNMEHSDTFRNAIHSMENSKDLTDDVNNLVYYLRQLEHLTFTIKQYHLNQSYISDPQNPLYGSNKITYLLRLKKFTEPWLKIISELRAYNDNDFNEMASLLNNLSGNLTDIERLASMFTKEEISAHIENRLKKFNEAVEIEYAPVIQKLTDLGLSEELAAIREEIQAKQYQVAKDLKGDSYVDKLLSGEMGDLVGGSNKGTNWFNKTTSAISNNITIAADQYFLNLSQAHDPVLASLGEFMDDVVNKSVEDFNSAIENRHKAEKLVKESGGSLAVGEKLITTEQRLVRRKMHNFTRDIDYYITETASVATFLNKYGAIENYKVIIDGVPTTLSSKTLSVLAAIYKDHGHTLPDLTTEGLQYQILLDFYDTVREYSLLDDTDISKEDIDSTVKDLKAIKDNFEAEWFNSYYTQDLQDVISLRYITDKNDREALEKILEIHNKLLKEKTQQSNILKYTASSIESELQARNAITELNIQIEALKDPKTREGQLLTEHLEKKNSFKETTNNTDALLKKLDQLYFLPNQKEYIKKKLNEILEIDSSNEQALLKKIIELHIKTSDPTFHSSEEASMEDVQELNEILNELVYYHESEDYFLAKTEITNKLSEKEMILNPGAYFMIIGESASQGLIREKVSDEENKVYDTMMDEDGKILLPVYKDISIGKETEKEGKFLYTFNFPVGGGLPAYVLFENGRAVPFKESNAAEAFEEIATISKKYRTKNLNQTELTVEDQIRVTELSQIIEDATVRNPKTLNGVNVDIINKQKIELYKELSEIRDSYSREEYYAGFKKVLSDFNAVSDPLLKKLRDSSKYYSHFRITIKDLLIDKNEEFANLVKDFESNSDLNIQDRAVLQWIKNNHYFSQVQKKSKDTTIVYTVLRPSRNHNKTVPSLDYFDLFFKANLDGAYRDTKYRKEFINQNHKDTKGRFLPKKIQSSEITDSYHKLSETDKEIHRLMVENVHIGEQQKKSNFVSNESYLWYDAPTLYKKAAELSLTQRAWKLYESIQGKINPLEQGLFGKDIIDNEDKEATKGLKNSAMKFVESLKSRSIGNIEKLSKEDKHDNYFTKKIPVDYTGRMEGDNVSRDFMSSVMDYTFSLNKAFHYSENISFVEGTVDSIADTKGKGTSKRRVRIEKYLDQVIFRRNIGSNNFISSLFRFVQKTLVLGSQTVGNPVGGVKNLIQSMIVNYMFSPPNAKYGWKVKGTDTVNSVKWLKKIATDRLKLDGKESLESFLVRRVNPNGANISELFGSDVHLKEFLNSGEFMYVFQNGGERMVTYQLMLSTFNSLYFTTEKNNSDTQVEFLDIWEETPNGWKMKTVYDKNGNVVDESIFLDIRRYINNFRFNTTGHGEKGVFLNNEIGKNLFFFMNFLVPTILNGFTSNRRNFIENRVMDNMHVSFVKNLFGMLTTLNSKAKRWDLMTNGQKVDFIKGAVLYSSMTVLYFIIRGLFGYDPDDDDKMEELKHMNYVEGLLLLSATKVMLELESQSFVSFTSKYPFPIITQNQTLISKPMVIDRLNSIFSVALDAVTLEEYKTSNKKLEIKKGDLKFLRELQSFVPYNIFSDYNPDLDPIQALYNLEGAKNRK